MFFVISLSMSVSALSINPNLEWLGKRLGRVCRSIALHYWQCSNKNSTNCFMVSNMVRINGGKQYNCNKIQIQTNKSNDYSVIVSSSS